MRKTILQTSIIFWIVSTIILFSIGIFDWYKNPDLVWVFWLVIPIQIWIIIRLLRKTKKGSSYWKQVWNGTLMSAITGILMIASSLVFTQVAFTDYFEVLRDTGEQILIESDATQEEIDRHIDTYNDPNIGVINAISGFLGSTVMGLIISLFAAYFIREKEEGK